MSVTLRQTPLTCSGHTRPVVHLAFSQLCPDGYFLISASKDGKPMLRQGNTGDWIGTFEGHKGAVWGVALNSDTSRAATGAADFTAKVWDAVSGEELHTFTHSHIVKTIDFSPSSTELLTGSNEKLLKIFDMGKPEADPQVFSGHTAGLKHVVFMNDGKQMLSCAEDKTIRVWDKASGQEVQKLEVAHHPTSMELSGDSKTLTVAYGSKVAFLNPETLEVQREVTVPTAVYSASLHPDRSVFICGGEDFKMYKFDYNTNVEIESFKGHFGPVHCVRFSPDGELYASGSEDGTLRLWQTTVGKTYGLWKCIDAAAENNIVPTKPEATV
ncbi:Serine-threonine kinase receptor-associated protein [Chionoecetes opilio]|uniref:Serine-threonine kinase receptor-associated protein n=1 Tax=Chionoecetes opilio TaxID=41210 RepID=A0A8J4XMB2_CHIOP|nr:Serine-threonine kinase receptor-associated protein [Chionoecetes opilio]